MIVQVLAIFISALSALVATMVIKVSHGEAVDRPDLAFGLAAALILLLPMVLVVLWRAFRAHRPYRSGIGPTWGERWFQAQAFILAIVMSGVIGAWLERAVAEWTVSTPLEGLAVPVGVLGALAVGGTLFLLLRRIPRVLLAWRLKGVVSTNAASDTIALMIGIGMLGTSLGLVFGVTAWSDLTRSIVIATAATLGYALPRLWLMRLAPHADPCLWLVLAHPNTVPNWPQLVDQIARSHRVGPFTLLSPPNAVPFGEHLHMADRLGMLDSLFPRLEIEVRDWQRALPPADRWSGVVHRQVHPPVALMPMLLDSYLGPLDQVLLIASCEDDVQIWRGRLPVDRTRVLWVAPPSEGPAGARPDRVAGYPVIVMDVKTRGRTHVQSWFSSQTEPSGAMFFISYLRGSDQPRAEALFRSLLRLGVNESEVWFDRQAIEPGQDFGQRILEGIHSCRYFLPLLSEGVNRREASFVFREWHEANNRQQDMSRAFVFPLIVDADYEPGRYTADAARAWSGIDYGHAPEGVPDDRTVAKLKTLVSDARRGKG